MHVGIYEFCKFFQLNRKNKCNAVIFCPTPCPITLVGGLCPSRKLKQCKLSYYYSMKELQNFCSPKY